MNEDGSMARMPDLIEFGRKHNIRIVAVEDLIRWRLRNEVLIEKMVDSVTSIWDLGQFRLQIYRSISDGKLHLALSMGDLSTGEPVLSRVQAASHVIDVFGFTTTDSWQQLEMALGMISKEGRGVLLYMNIAGQDHQEVLRSMRVHLGEIADKGLTNAVGDGALRELGTGAQILVDLGVSKMRLMTNNPRKIVGLEGFGIKVVERVPLQAAVSEDNLPFLRSRRVDLGHLINIQTEKK